MKFIETIVEGFKRLFSSKKDKELKMIRSNGSTTSIRESKLKGRTK